MRTALVWCPGPVRVHWKPRILPTTIARDPLPGPSVEGSGCAPFAAVPPADGIAGIWGANRTAPVPNKVISRARAAAQSVNLQ